MNWKKINIYCTPQAFEVIGAMLMDNGINGFIINDPNNLNELYNPDSAQWDYIDDDIKITSPDDCNIEVYLADNKQGSASLFNIKESLQKLKSNKLDFDLGTLNITCDDADDKLWKNTWKKYFKPLKIGETFYIKPSWESIKEKHSRHIIEIDPANSFGTGTHATTQLCLCALEKAKIKNCHVLDLGCGSGILGIGAALSGAKSITFVDIDIHCIETSRLNSLSNGIDKDILSFLSGNIISDKLLRKAIGHNKYHLIFANIMAEILIEMSPILCGFLVDGGYIILSGIICERLEAVKEAFIASNFTIISVNIQNGWCSITVQK